MQNSALKNSFLTLVFVAVGTFAAQAATSPHPSVCSLFSWLSPSRSVTLAEGEPIYLELVSDTPIDELEVGNALNFRVVSNVLVDGREVIRAFTPAVGTVTRIEEATQNTAAKVQISVRFIRAVDGQQVLVEGPHNLFKLSIGVNQTVYVKNAIKIDVR